LELFDRSLGLGMLIKQRNYRIRVQHESLLKSDIGSEAKLPRAFNKWAAFRP
jgi:hypothetical protein